MVLNGLHSRYDRSVVEQAAVAGALRPEAAAGPDGAAMAARIAARLDLIADEFEKGWTGEARDQGYLLTRTVRSVTQVAVLDHQLLNSADARKLHERAATLAEAYAKPRCSTARARTRPCSGRCRSSMR